MNVFDTYRKELSEPCVRCVDKCLLDTADTRIIEVADQTTNDIQEFGGWHKDLELTLMQLDPGVFRGETTFIDLHDVFIVNRKSNLRYFAYGGLPGYVCFSFPLDVQEPHYCKKGLYNKYNQIVSNDETDTCSIYPDHFEEIIIGIKIDALNRYLSKAEIDNFLSSTDSDKLMVVHDCLNVMTTHFAKQFYDEILNIYKCCINNKVFVGQRCKLIVLFLYQFIANYHKTDELEKKSTSYERILDRGLRYIFCNGGASITLEKLSSGIFASKRSIQYAFSELIGMTPLEFSKLLRLNVIRNDLLTMSQQKMTVAHVLHNYHIKNSGRFRHEYFDFFKEYPRDTLKQGMS